MNAHICDFVPKYTRVSHACIRAFCMLVYVRLIARIYASLGRIFAIETNVHSNVILKQMDNHSYQTFISFYLYEALDLYALELNLRPIHFRAYVPRDALESHSSVQKD